MAGYRILVTGSRTWTNWETVSFALTIEALDARANGCVRLTVVTGACPDGADEWARKWVTAHDDRFRGLGVALEPHPADWHPDGHYDRTAGFRRNELLVSLGADVTLAFVMPCTMGTCRRPGPHGTHGTEHCAALAAKAGIEVRRFTDG